MAANQSSITESSPDDAAERRPGSATSLVFADDKNSHRHPRLQRLMQRVWVMAGKPQVNLELLQQGSLPVRAGAWEANLPVIRFHHVWALLALFFRPTQTFGALYRAGRISVTGELTSVMETVYRGLADAEAKRGLVSLFQRLTPNSPPSNSLRRARGNIHRHYDLGNEFYRLWLDAAYDQYTCAYYINDHDTLEAAQIAKLELIGRKLNLQPGETVVEAGGGWGGLARYFAKRFSVNVRSYNISHEQVTYARARVQREGLGGQVEYVEDDYRNITGQYDAFVSVGMLEHVGLDQFSVLGATIDRCLAPDGRGFIHTIGQRRPRRLNPWIERQIFPGAYAPTLKQMMTILEPSGFEVTDVENLRAHYALTLRHWTQRFEANAHHVRRMFDEEFERTWRLYLHGSTAAFTAGGLQLFQVVFRRPNSRALPQTRGHLYSDTELRDPL